MRGNVEWLAEAYRHWGRSELADLVIANRHRDFSPAECRAALAMVMAEAQAQLVVLQARRGFSADPLNARLQALLFLTNDELAALRADGFLDDLGEGL